MDNQINDNQEPLLNDDVSAVTNENKQKNSRKKLIIFTIVFVLVICSIYILMIISRPDPYFKSNLSIYCQKGDSCCQSSHKFAKSDLNNIIIDKNENCPEGYVINNLKCVSSLVWCEPTKDNGDNQTLSITGIYHDKYEGTKYWGSPCYLEDDNGNKHTVNCLYNKDLSGKKLEITGVNVEPKKVPDDYEGAVAGDYWPGYIKILDYSIEEISCVKEGGYVDHPSKDSFTCCSGLSKTSALPLNDNCKVIIPENSPGIEPGWTCVKCGDGICNSQANESKCNCPEDCAGVVGCVKEGEYQRESSLECCLGLVARTEKVIYQADCMPLPNAGVSLPICIPCGDGVCNSEFESECNCPEDCQTQTGQDELIYSKRSSWGPCANPDGGCWQKEYLYQNGKYETVTMNGTSTKILNEEAMKIVTDYIRSADLLTDSCEYNPVLDLWITYTLYLDGNENRIDFPGCEDKLDKLDRLIEINSLEILSRQEIIGKAKTNLYDWLNEKDNYQVSLDKLELQNYETPVCKYSDNRQPIRTDSCWSVGYPGRNIIDEINNIDAILEKLYYISFEIESNHQSGCGLVGGDVLITNRGRIIKTDEIVLCID